ncbi:tRNA-specific 2-thiouridylase [Candidatus Saccharibacteria bacterium]|nr:tRNA-specific 2-thiouridylase [Candidatus Saccharibacteria bacterium]
MSAKPVVFVGMSGGVDSSVSAALLKEQGYRVVGVYMKNWSRDLPGMKCPWAEDLADAKRVAVRLGIDFEVFDFEKEYKQKVVDYMLSEFKKGNTPNPDIMCNQEIKFKLFYDVAREKGADFIATGHYARVYRKEGATDIFSDLRDQRGATIGRSPVTTGRPTGAENMPVAHSSSASLLRAKDENKDQTYFLYRISDEALSHTIFPIGNMLKSDVKKLAAGYGFDNAYKKESMGVCFVGEVGIKDFLKEYLPVKPGKIKDIDSGETLGAHEGAWFYTIGQRKGLNIGGGLPIYVVKKDLAKNIVYVSKNLNNAELWTTKLSLKDVILRGEPADESGKIEVRLRHRASLIPATLKIKKDKAVVVFESEIKAPASGQSVVFYDGEICLGGGIIE